MTDRVVRIGVIGIGGGAAAMIPVVEKHPGFRWTAGADLDTAILERFARDHDVETFTDAEAMCASPNVDAVYIATPNRFHVENALSAIEHGKHVLCEKPMTITMDEADVIIDAAERRGVQLAVNVKHSFERRVLKLREIVRSGVYGRLRMMNYLYYNDWLYKPRTPEELTPEWGGGVPWRQGPHQIDILRTIGGGMVRSVRGLAGTWDEGRRVPGMHSAFLDFEDGSVATAVYSGHDHMHTANLMRGMSDRGPLAREGRHARARREFADDAAAEAAAAASERYGGARDRTRSGGAGTTSGGRSGGWMSGGLLIVSLDHADIWVQPEGLLVFGDEQEEEIPLPDRHGDGRWGRIQSFHDAIINDHPPAADGGWGRATLEVILAILESGRERREIMLSHQTPTADDSLAAILA